MRSRFLPRTAVYALMLALVLLAGCASLSDSRFLKNALDDGEKSKVLTDKGIELYDLNLVRGENFHMVDEIRRYFEVALRYDPGNTVAAKYLEDLNGFSERKLEESVETARSLLKKPKRTDAENFELLQAVRRASLLDPENPEVAELERATELLRTSLVTTYASKGKALVDSVNEKDSNQKKERVYAQAIEFYRIILLIDPDQKNASLEVAALEERLASLFELREGAAKQSVSKGQFDQAKKDLAALRSLNGTLEGRFDNRVKELAYSLYFGWAKRSYGQKKYAAAGDLIDSALAVNRTSEALNLKKQIQAQRRKAEEGSDFEAYLDYVDSLIERTQLGDAQRALTSMLEKTQDQGRRKQLEQRAVRVRSFLPELYRRAVEYYKEEDFKNAIELLETVVDVDPRYEQAASYLEKARSKRQLLESI